MTQETKLFHITEYTPDYAASLAEMWNRSGASWGGSAVHHTEQGILDDHACSTNLVEFLAVDKNDEVIGFCSFSRYFKDTGALYIPLLNVRPDWHGKKVGKALVLAAVKQTISMGWPRLDLFTWPGNTKAVPTYKKCGFFWERRDDTTHLMNFIPTVMQTELLQPFFSQASWYDDAVREIRVEPDGRSERGFDYYTYVWQHDNQYARADFEKTGRGLCLIETDDFLVAMELDAHQVVSGRELPVRFRCVNKSGRPMKVQISGEGDGPVHSHYCLAADIRGTQLLEGSFNAEQLPEPQNLMRTHPCVMARVLVNGRSALFRTGIDIRPPAVIKLRELTAPCYAGEKRTGWIELENCFDEQATLTIDLPVTDVLAFQEHRIQCQLQDREKKSVPCQLTIMRDGCWSAEAAASSYLSSGERIDFAVPLHGLVKGWHSCCSGEDDESWFIVNGRFSWHLGKDGGWGTVRGFRPNTSTTRFYCPSLGRPYSNEFDTTRPEHVIASKQPDGSMVQEADFYSHDFPGLVVRSIAQLWPHGELQRTLAVINRTDKALDRPVFLSDHVWHDLTDGAIPYDGRIMQLVDENEADYDLYDVGRLSERWLFAGGQPFTRGLCWQQDVKVIFTRGLVFEHEPGKLAAEETWQAPPVRLVCGMFDSWQDFRVYATSLPHLAKPEITGTLVLTVNRGNPVLQPVGHEPVEPLLLRIDEHKKINRQVQISATFGQSGKPVVFQQEIASGGLDLPLSKPDETLSSLEMTFDMPDQSFSVRRQLFVPSHVPVKLNSGWRDNRPILSADNGPFSIALSPDFSHALMSLCVDGHEWLDTTFPQPEPRSWFNSWPGGLSAKPWGLQHATIHAAERNGAYAQLSDQHGNHWSGLSSTYRIEDHPKFGGLTVTVYWVMLPGIPLLAQVVHVQNRTGRILQNEEMGCELFFRPQRDLQQCWFEARDTAGTLRRYRGGQTEHDLTVQQSVLLGADGIQQRLQVITRDNPDGQSPMANNALIAWMKGLRVTVADQASGWTEPVFFLASTAGVPLDSLGDLLALELREREAQHADH